MGVRVTLAAVLTALASAGCESSPVLGRASASIPGGVVLRVKRMAAPAQAVGRYGSFGGAPTIAGGTRYYYDPAGRVYGGFELRVRPVANGQFMALVEALGVPIEELAVSAAGYRCAPMPALPSPKVLKPWI